MRLIDLSGQQFNAWSALEYVGKKGYKCKCKCGTIRIVQRGNLTTGSSRSCRQCSEFAVEIHNKLPKGEGAFNDLYGHYKAGAHNRGLCFDLPKPLAHMLFKLPCNYCGQQSSSVWPTGDRVDMNGKFLYGGIDRVDPSVGYISTNVVPCCKRCNIAKRTFSESDFIAHAMQIADYQREVEAL